MKITYLYKGHYINIEKVSEFLFRGNVYTKGNNFLATLEGKDEEELVCVFHINMDLSL